MPEKKVNKLDIFVINKAMPGHYGTFNNRKYGLIAIPPTFEIQTDQEFEAAKGDILSRLSRSSFSWEDPLSKKLKDFIMLTDDERKFVLAQQLGYLDSFETHTLIFMKLAFYCAHYGIFALLNHVSGANDRLLITGRQSMIYFNFLWASVATVILYLLAKDLYDNSLDSYADRYAAMISPAIAEAGVSYYDKQIEANKAIRQMIPKMEKKITSQGNETSKLGVRYRLPLSTKKALVMNQLDLHKLQNQKENVPEQPTNETAV